MPVPGSGISKDDAFHLLQNPRRRAVLRYMVDQDGPNRLTTRKLAEEIAAWEHDTTIHDLTSDQRQRVYIALYQTHLPKLAEYGVIQYDQSNGIVEPTDLINALVPLLGDGLYCEDLLSIPDTAGESKATDAEHSRLTKTVSTFLSK